MESSRSRRSPTRRPAGGSRRCSATSPTTRRSCARSEVPLGQEKSTLEGRGRAAPPARPAAHRGRAAAARGRPGEPSEIQVRPDPRPGGPDQAAAEAGRTSCPWWVRRSAPAGRRVVEAWTGIPHRPDARGRDRCCAGGGHRRALIGQRTAVTAVSDAVRRSRTRHQPAPKTEPIALTGSFRQARAIVPPARLGPTRACGPAGAAPLRATSGIDEGGQLTEAVRRRPYSVVLPTRSRRPTPSLRHPPAGARRRPADRRQGPSTSATRC